MKKKPMYENFVENEETFSLAQSYWKQLIKDNLRENSNALSELDRDLMSDSDGNPIYYQHFPSLNKSIRIIQEQVRPNSRPHLGAWIEVVSDFRDYDELVISIELTSATTKSVKKIIDMWFSSPLNLELQGRKLDRILEKQLSRNKGFDDLEF
ncbi:hypothetical protein P7M67_25705 [Vibrio parahaemolyticus]|nr:hypothetical protein [Vibrio parahaemolyticus]